MTSHRLLRCIWGGNYCSRFCLNLVCHIRKRTRRNILFVHQHRASFIKPNTKRSLSVNLFQLHLHNNCDVPKNLFYFGKMFISYVSLLSVCKFMYQETHLCETQSTNHIIVDKLLWFYIRITLSSLNHSFISLTQRFNEHSVSLDWGRNPENPEDAPEAQENMRSLQGGNARRDSSLQPWRCELTVLS